VGTSIPVVLLTFTLLISAEGVNSPQPQRVKPYKENASGLKDLFEDALRAQKEGNTVALQAIAQDLLLPDHDTWWNERFAPGRAAQLSSWYAPRRENMGQILSNSLQRMLDEQFTEVDAWEFKGPCAPAMREQDAKSVFLRLQKPTPLFEVRFKSRGGFAAKYLRYFTLLDGKFRFVGPLQLPAEPPPKQPVRIPEERQRVAGTVQAAKLVDMVRPVYPEQARMASVSGTVRLQAIIGTDGRVEELEVLSGDPLLLYSAVDAVCQWRYDPTRINGQPIEVLTTIDVIFTRQRR
jgi:TonB family protein